MAILRIERVSWKISPEQSQAPYGACNIKPQCNKKKKITQGRHGISNDEGKE